MAFVCFFNTGYDDSFSISNHGISNYFDLASFIFSQFHRFISLKKTAFLSDFIAFHHFSQPEVLWHRCLPVVGRHSARPPDLRGRRLVSTRRRESFFSPSTRLQRGEHEELVERWMPEKNTEKTTDSQIHRFMYKTLSYTHHIHIMSTYQRQRMYGPHCDEKVAP